MTKRFRPHIKTLQSFQSGPLGTHLERFASLLIEEGYSSEAGWDKIRLVADLSRWRSEEHTSELQSPMYVVCRLLLENLTGGVTADEYAPFGARDGERESYA